MFTLRVGSPSPGLLLSVCSLTNFGMFYLNRFTLHNEFRSRAQSTVFRAMRH